MNWETKKTMVYILGNKRYIKENRVAKNKITINIWHKCKCIIGESTRQGNSKWCRVIRYDKMQRTKES